MNGLRKFEERGTYGEGPARTAYVLNPEMLPSAATGFEWRPVTDFRPGEAILAEPNLKLVFDQALRHGVALVAAADAMRSQAANDPSAG